MIQILKGFITDIINGWKVMHFLAHVYDNESKLEGEMYQHYGFKSFPPLFKDGEKPRIKSIIVHNGNNVYSIAERDIGFDDEAAGFQEGVTILYADNYAHLMSKLVAVRNIENPTNTIYYLVNEKFLVDFCSHVHTSAAPGSPTTTPLIAGTPVTPAMLEPDLTQTLKAD